MLMMKKEQMLVRWKINHPVRAFGRTSLLGKEGSFLKAYK